MTLQTILAHCVLIAGAASALVAQTQPVELRPQIKLPFRFVAYGDTRFTDPRNTEASNPSVRQALVQAIAEAHPAFISISGDIPYKGGDGNDWKIWDKETAVWSENKIPVYPALGNHDLYGDEKVALANYFQRFPDLQNSRYYAVRAANTLLLMLDSSVDETSGPQGEWLIHELDRLEEREYWEQYFELTRVHDAHDRRRCRDQNGSEPWACGDCECTERLERKLEASGKPFLKSLGNELIKLPSPEEH